MISGLLTYSSPCRQNSMEKTLFLQASAHTWSFIPHLALPVTLGVEYCKTRHFWVKLCFRNGVKTSFFFLKKKEDLHDVLVDFCNLKL